MKKYLSLFLLFCSTTILASEKPAPKEFPKICKVTCEGLTKITSDLSRSIVGWRKTGIQREFYLYSIGLPFPETVQVTSAAGIEIYDGMITLPRTTNQGDLAPLPFDFRGMMISPELLASMIEVNPADYQSCSIDYYLTDANGEIRTKDLEYAVDTMVKFDLSPLHFKTIYSSKESYTSHFRVITGTTLLKPKAKKSIEQKYREYQKLGVCR